MWKKIFTKRIGCTLIVNWLISLNERLNERQTGLKIYTYIHIYTLPPRALYKIMDLTS